jgi:hypothetical protein
MSTSRKQAVAIDRGGQVAAVDFCRGLARTLGPTFRIGLYATDPPEEIDGWGPARRWREGDSGHPILPLVAAAANAEAVVNRPVGRGRISVLLLPPVSGEPPFALAIEANSSALNRAAHILASLADPEREQAPATLQEPATHVGDALDRLLQAGEERAGVPIDQMSRSQKQQVVKYLDDRGAFLLKKAVEQVASRLGVSRFTIYNYLDEVKREDGER